MAPEETANPDCTSLLLPGNPDPIGYVCMLPMMELSGVRLMLGGVLYEGVVTGKGEPIVFEVA